MDSSPSAPEENRAMETGKELSEGNQVSKKWLTLCKIKYKEANLITCLFTTNSLNNNGQKMFHLAYVMT